MSIAYEVVRQFEKTVAEYAGAKYGVSMDSCSHALFLCCKYLFDKWGFNDKYNSPTITIPKRTYVGVANAIVHAGGTLMFVDKKWSGVYQLKPFPIYDSALRFKRGMYIKDSYYCLSFQYTKKHIPIGRGGMILTDNRKAVEWFKQMRFDGRHEKPLDNQGDIKLCGWNMYMTPEQAARGLLLFDTIKDLNMPDLKRAKPYPDLSKLSVFQ